MIIAAGYWRRCKVTQCHNVTMSLTHGNKGLIIPLRYNNAPCRPMNEALTIKNVHKLQQLKALTRVPPQSGCRPSVTIHSGLDSLPNFPIVVIGCQLHLDQAAAWKLFTKLKSCLFSVLLMHPRQSFASL